MKDIHYPQLFDNIEKTSFVKYYLFQKQYQNYNTKNLIDFIMEHYGETDKLIDFLALNDLFGVPFPPEISGLVAIFLFL